MEKNNEKSFDSGYKTFIIREEIPKEIEKLQRDYDQSLDYHEKLDLAYRIAKLAMSVEKWKKSMKILKSIISEKDSWKDIPQDKRAPILRDLGVSMTKYYSKSYKNFEKGRKYLLRATNLNSNDSDAYASLGGTWKGFNNENALKYYKKALKANENNPYPLVNSLILEIQKSKNFKLSKGKIKQIHSAMEIRKKQIEEWKDLPWPFYDLGTFSLLLGNIEESLNFYLLAIKYSPDDWMIQTTLKTLNQIDNVENKPEDFKLIKILFLLAIAFKIKSKRTNNQKRYDKTLKRLKEEGLEVKESNLTSPLVIIAGGLPNLNEREKVELKRIFKTSFNNFKGTIICGCPEYGINEIVSDLYINSSQIMATINALIYVPHIPLNELGDFSFIHRSSGIEFSILEILQYWFDILNSTIIPSKIKLIGIKGGRLSFFEYRIAISFGAHVGILTEENGTSSDFHKEIEWDDIISDKRNQKFYRLYKKIFPYPENVTNFLESKYIKDIDNENLGALLIGYLENQTCIYQKEFSIIEINGDGVVGLTLAIQNFSNEIGIGKVPRIEAVNGQLTTTDLKDKPFRIIFLLFDKPSETLLGKISLFAEKVEQNFGDILLEHAQRSLAYPGGPEMDQLLADIFGSEIL